MQYKANKGSSKISSNKCLPLRGVYGILMLFVIGSIGFTSYLVLMGTTGLVPKLLVAPQLAFAAIVLIYLSYNK